MVEQQVPWILGCAPRLPPFQPVLIFSLEKLLKPCAFPFIYQNVKYDHCTTINSDYAWCSVEHIFNGKWRYCTSTDPPPCMFPFLFGSKWYHDCTADGFVLGKTWCALTHNYNMNGLWKQCSPNDLA
ncbi:binder of sperm protein homolog 2-like [Gracilinanus agilis]|uniref:binder of sperm protein homolog 2-like n=1 Tax=Gracilinanus agilis TaxID=191870 RepID=UPI001CFEC389|nr:binder of sperm protein homolog 2-like [Gracilinanus agilis]